MVLNWCPFDFVWGFSHVEEVGGASVMVHFGRTNIDLVLSKFSHHSVHYGAFIIL